MSSEIFNICGKSITQRGLNKIELDVADLASGTKIFLPLYVFSGKKPGKNVLLIGGLHGDEINGMEIVRRMILELKNRGLERGSVIAIPLLNIYGFINFSRDVVEGKDINRSFPGSSKGSLAARLAKILSEKIIPQIDLSIDFHTGGATRYNYPQIRYSKGHEESEKLAAIFNAPVTIASNIIPKSFRAECINQDKPVIVFEGGESKRMDTISIEKGILGTLNVLAKNELIDEDFMRNNSRKFENSRWIRAEEAGLFILSKKSGEIISKDEKLGRIAQIDHEKSEIEVVSDQNGMIIGHNNSPVINQGDALFHIAYE
ncbi:MAG: succinylglutamate desuccinylase/aspartoacylase family protein [Bacteroidota bacterium]